MIGAAVASILTPSESAIRLIFVRDVGQSIAFRPKTIGVVSWSIERLGFISQSPTSSATPPIREFLVEVQ